MDGKEMAKLRILTLSLDVCRVIIQSILTPRGEGRKKMS
jgi:hypothetical protein